MLETIPPSGSSIIRNTLRVTPNAADTRLATPSFLTATEREALRDCPVSRRSLRTGADLVHAGEPSANLVFVEKGWACQFKTTRDGRRQISAVLVPSDISNLDILMFESLDLDVQMLTAGTILLLSRQRVLALAAEYPGIARAVTWFACVENAILSRWTLCLGRLSARERLAHLLCELAVRLGQTDHDGEISFDMPLTQEHLADILGLTPVHINRTMRQLRDEGLLGSTLRLIAIPDIAALRRVCDFEPDYLHEAERQVGLAISNGDQVSVHSFTDPQGR